MYAGIDYDTNAVHIVLVPEEGIPTYLPFVLYGHDAFERTRAVRDVMPARGWWEDEGIIAIGIEEPMGHSTRPLNRMQGAILSCLPAGLLVQPWRPGEWRKEVGLPGNATKEDVARFAGGLLWPDAPLRVVPSSQDACDAFCIALATQLRTELVVA